MLNTLRSRLIVSHLLTLLVVMPVVGLALIYVFETRLLVDDLSNELIDQARLLAAVARDNPSIWEDSNQADAYVDRLAEPMAAHVTLLDATGHVLASNARVEAVPDLTPLFSGGVDTLTLAGNQFRTEFVDVLVPVRDTDEQIVGVIWLAHQHSGLTEQFMQSRMLIAVVMLGGLLIGVMVGWVLALNLERPIRDLAQAVFQLTDDRSISPVPVRGPKELQVLAQAFNGLSGRLRALEESRRRLLANLVHELGRPLGALLAADQALLNGAIEDVALRGELLLGMQGEVGRLRHLLDDLSQLYDRDLGKLELNLRPLDLAAWLPGVLASRREAARAKGLKWQVNLPTSLPTIMADADRLAQVVGNLLSNATKYTPPGGKVSVDVGVEGDKVCLRVGDSGPGIAPEDRAFIFEPFYRSQAGPRFPQGMGLGLSIARDIAAAHGGRLMLEHSSLEGSRFALLLPSGVASKDPDEEAQSTTSSVD